MAYSYDRRAASVRPEVAIHVQGREVTLSVLVGHLLGAYKKRVEGDSDALQGELLSLKGRLESLSGSDAEALDSKVSSLLDDLGFRFSTDFNDRDDGLAKKQSERRREADKARGKEFGKWLRAGVVDLVVDIYRKYRSGRFRSEPCVTASYIKDMLDGIRGWDDHRSFFRGLDNRKQLAVCHYALESARKKGKLNSSTGQGITGRETRCYEPLSW